MVSRTTTRLGAAAWTEDAVIKKADNPKTNMTVARRILEHNPPTMSPPFLCLVLRAAPRVLRRPIWKQFRGIDRKMQGARF